MTAKDKRDKISPVMHVHFKAIPQTLWKRFRERAWKESDTAQNLFIRVVSDYLKTAAK